MLYFSELRDIEHKKSNMRTCENLDLKPSHILTYSHILYSE